MSRIKSAGEILANEIGLAVEKMRGCVTPIFDVNERGEAELLGTAVLVAIDGSTFLCTAYHVIQDHAKSTLYIDGPSRLEELSGVFLISRSHDVAVLPLTSEQVKILRKYRPLPGSLIASRAETLASKYVEVIGFPESKNRKAHNRRQIKGQLYSVAGTVRSITITRVRLNFGKKANLDRRTRMRVTAPDPYGMSGGGMFGAPVNGETIHGRPQPKLIGIVTDWLRDSGEMSGTAIGVVLAIIASSGSLLPAKLKPGG